MTRSNVLRLELPAASLGLYLFVWGLLAPLSTDLLFTPSTRPLHPAPDSSDASGWVAADFHMHSCLTDGEHSPDEVFREGVGYGLHFLVNSEHGGAYNRAPDCRPWTAHEGVTFRGDPAPDRREQRAMWRWQSLQEYAFPFVQQAEAKFEDAMFALGLEWNPPGVDHASVGIVADSPVPISTFAYRFDRRDLDTSGGPADRPTEKFNGRLDGGAGELGSDSLQQEHALEALAWLQQHHPKSSYVIPAHPERSMGYTVADLRRWNDAAPRIAFGFEGMPGAQSAPIRGGFRSERALGGGTYGGVGYMAARVGGTWDALLGEGRRFWIFTNSDFHRTNGGFWPGEYQKTWVHTTDTTSRHAVIDGMRSGRVFVAQGDLIDRLSFSVSQDGRSAEMGGTLAANGDSDVSVTVSYRTPEVNHNGDQPRVDHIAVIAGGVGPRADPGSPAYHRDTHAEARVLKVLRHTEGTTLPDGWTRHEFALGEIEEAMYLRLRGSSHGAHEPPYTGAEGDPLPDALAFNAWILEQIGNGELQDSQLLPEAFNWGREHAWKNTWFYSNPVFLEPGH